MDQLTATHSTTTPDGTGPPTVRPLMARLREYERRLPPEVEVDYNELASLAAAARMDAETAG